MDLQPVNFSTKARSWHPRWLHIELKMAISQFRLNLERVYRCRRLADIEPTCKHGVGPISAISRHLPMSARYNFRHQADVAADISRCRADTEPLLFSDIGPTSSLYRPDIVDDIWPTSSPRANIESARYQPTFADVGPI